MSSSLAGFISTDLIVIGLQAKDKEEVVRRLASILKDKGYVKDDYADAVLEREKSFPTGLPTAEIQVAIPHTDTTHCLKPGMAVATLARPVEFGEMATSDKTVSVDIVFLLSLTDPKDQVKWLQRLVTVFEQPGSLRRLKEAADSQTCYNTLYKLLSREEVVRAESK